MNTNLHEVKTLDLLRELEARAGVQKISVGPYQTYGLKQKYKNDRSVLTPDLVLIINDLNHLDA